MITSNRTVVVLSSRSRGTWGIAALALVGVTGCPDAQKRMDDFSARVVDARPANTIDATPLADIPDVTGTFYMALSTHLNPDNPILSIVTTTLHNSGSAPTIDLQIQPLSYKGCVGAACPSGELQPVGTVISILGTPVTSSGEFLAKGTPTPPDPPHTMKFPGAANPFTHGDIEVELAPFATGGPEFIFNGGIKTRDRYCGTVQGHILVPSDIVLTYSTDFFSAIRVAPGTYGAALPTPELTCPTVIYDAGTID